MVWREIVTEGKRPSKWYLGDGYYDFNLDVRVVYPIPLNLLVQVGRWVKILVAYRSARYLRRYERSKVYNFGYEEGYRRGCVKGSADALTMMDRNERN